MLDLRLLITLCMSFILCMGAMEKQLTGPGSAGSAALPAAAGQLIAPPGGLAVPNAAAVLTAEQKAKVEQVNKQVDSLFGDHNWKQQKEIITKAVEEGVHPDSIGVYDKPLGEALREKEKDDINFARFLLQHGADPTKRGSFGLLLARAKTPAVAQLLFDHGASKAVCEHGAELLSAKFRGDGEVNIPMIAWYIQNGANVNGTHDGVTPLHAAVFDKNVVSREKENSLEAFRLLMQAGALLSLGIILTGHVMNGYTVPQILRSKLEDSRYTEKQKALLGDIKTTLSTALDNRHKQLQCDVVVATNLIPEIAAIIRCFYGSTYQELEDAPYPSQKRNHGPASFNSSESPLYEGGIGYYA